MEDINQQANPAGGDQNSEALAKKVNCCPRCGAWAATCDGKTIECLKCGLEAPGVSWAQVPAAQGTPVETQAKTEHPGSWLGWQVEAYDKFLAALKQVRGFMLEDDSRPSLHGVLLEIGHHSPSDEPEPQVLEITACNGYSLGHVRVEGLTLPISGKFLLSAEGVKAVCQCDGKVEVVLDPPRLIIGAVPEKNAVFELVNGDTYPDYQDLVPADKDDTMVIISTKEWIKALKNEERWENVGVVFSKEGCWLLFETEEPGIKVNVPAQMFAGQEKRIVYNVKKLKRALSSCGTSATIKIGADPTKPIYMEAENYWHLISPMKAPFPKELDLNEGERDLLKWGVEALRSVLKGEVNARVVVGEGRFYLEIGAHIARTEVIMGKPELIKKEVSIDQQTRGQGL